MYRNIFAQVMVVNKGLRICDVIYESLPHGGINIVNPDQTPRLKRGVSSGPSIYVPREHLQKTFLSLPVQCLP